MQLLCPAHGSVTCTPKQHTITASKKSQILATVLGALKELEQEVYQSQEKPCEEKFQSFQNIEITKETDPSTD